MTKTLFICIFIFFQTIHANDAKIDFDDYSYALILNKRSESYNPNEIEAYTNSLFMKDLNVDSRFLHGILPKSFQKYRMDLHSSFQKKIDLIYADILKTKTGQKICLQRTDGSLQSIINYFGITENLAKKIIPICQPTDSNKRKLLYPQKYYLVATEENFALDSWTSHKNETYFYVYTVKFKNVYTAEFDRHLTNLIIHELNIKSDTTETILSKLLEDPKSVKTNFNECEIKSAINNPYIKNAFRSIRSFELERQLLSEMNLQKESSNLNYTCKERIKNILQPIINIASELRADDAYFAYTVINKCGQNLNQLPKNLDKIVDILSSTYIVDGLQEINLCEYLSIPKYTSQSRQILTGGPRPRVGGGSSDDVGDSTENSLANIEDLIFKLNNKTKKSFLNKHTDHFENYKVNVENYSEWMD